MTAQNRLVGGAIKGSLAEAAIRALTCWLTAVSAAPTCDHQLHQNSLLAERGTWHQAFPAQCVTNDSDIRGPRGSRHSQGVVGHHDFTSTAAVVPHQNAQLGLGTLHRCSRRGAEAGPAALGDLPLKDSCPPQANVPAQETVAQRWERWQALLDRRSSRNNINGWLPACLVHHCCLP